MTDNLVFVLMYSSTVEYVHVHSAYDLQGNIDVSLDFQCSLRSFIFLTIYSCCGAFENMASQGINKHVQ